MVYQDASTVVRDAIVRSYKPQLEVIFRTHNPGPRSEGSTFLEPQSLESLMRADWSKYEHSEIKPPAQGFRANIPGKLGIVKIGELCPETPCTMTLEHKGSLLFVSPLVDREFIPRKLQQVSFTTILLGPSEDRLIVWTFFPGDPVSPSDMRETLKTKAVHTVKDVINLGFDYVKIRG